MLVTLSAALSRAGCRVRVALFRDPRGLSRAVEEQARSAGLRVAPIDCHGRWDWSAVRALRTIFAEEPPDILHAHGYKADLYAYAAAWRRRLPLVATCHNWPDPHPRMQAYAKLDRFILRSFDHITTPSQDVAQVLLSSGIASARITWVRNGIDIEAFRHAKPSLLRDPSETLVGFVGRLVPEKGGETFLRAAQRVLAVRRNVRFIMVGDGPAGADWKTLAAQLGIERHVDFTGTRDDMPGVYASLDMFVLPSHNEAMPMSVLEAMSAGKPVIATRVGAVPTLVLDGETGHLCAPGDADQIARSVLALLQNSEEAHRLGENGYRRVHTEFSSEAMAETYLRLYRNVLTADANGVTQPAACPESNG
ncbi:MAG TPA: glycosyltransferase family 4 protein [Bryobacteraceae bacterium]|nr:glycosyltransferase family 4 protein [Bryobacteraceae bacterium]